MFCTGSGLLTLSRVCKAFWEAVLVWTPGDLTLVGRIKGFPGRGFDVTALGAGVCGCVLLLAGGMTNELPGLLCSNCSVAASSVTTEICCCGVSLDVGGFGAILTCTLPGPPISPRIDELPTLRTVPCCAPGECISVAWPPTPAIALGDAIAGCCIMVTVAAVAAATDVAGVLGITTFRFGFSLVDLESFAAIGCLPFRARSSASVTSSPIGEFCPIRRLLSDFCEAKLVVMFSAVFLPEAVSVGPVPDIPNLVLGFSKLTSVCTLGLPRDAATSTDLPAVL